MNKQTNTDIEIVPGVVWTVAPTRRVRKPKPAVIPPETTAADLIRWGEAHRYYFQKIERIPEKFTCVPIEEDTSIIPNQVLNLIREIKGEFPEAEILLAHEPQKPPVHIPWRTIFKMVKIMALTIGVAFVAMGAVVLLVYLIKAIATILSVILIISALALVSGVDPLVIVRIRGELCCVAVYYD